MVLIGSDKATEKEIFKLHVRHFIMTILMKAKLFTDKQPHYQSYDAHNRNIRN